MTMPVFPAYAQFVRDGFKPQREKNALRTPFEDGYIKQAPINSRRLTSAPVKYLLRSEDDRLAFDAWIERELRFGTAWFAWIDPMGGATRRARIRDGEVEYEPLTNRFDEWAATFVIEYWS